MMTLIVVLLISLVVAAARRAFDPPIRGYVGFVLAGLGALVWAVLFDVFGHHGNNVVTDAALYKRVLIWSALGALSSIAGVVTSLWCRDRLLKVAGVLVGIAAAIMCAANIIVPY
jgi:hypothetical protein